MPRRDGTGPEGAGALTGRGLGSCDGSGSFVRSYGYGCRGRRGFGRGIGGGFRFIDSNNNDASLRAEIDDLKAKIDTLSSHLDQNN